VRTAKLYQRGGDPRTVFYGGNYDYEEISVYPAVRRASDLRDCLRRQRTRTGCVRSARNGRSKRSSRRRRGRNARRDPLRRSDASADGARRIRRAAVHACAEGRRYHAELPELRHRRRRRLQLSERRSAHRDQGHRGRQNKQVIYVADLWIRNIHSFRTAFGNGEFGSGTEDPVKLVQRENALFAVNGSYNQGLTVHAGEQFKGVRANKGWNSQATCVIYKDGSMKTFQLEKESFDIKAELKNGAWHAWQFGPILIRDYEISPYAYQYRIGNKARNILGYYEPGHYVIVTCDAGTKKAEGMTEVQMAEFMKSLNVKEAFNLDGGTSAVMVFMGEIINNPRPHVNEQGSLEEGRNLKDMLLFGEYDENGVSADLSTFTADKFKGK